MLVYRKNPEPETREKTIISFLSHILPQDDLLRGSYWKVLIMVPWVLKLPLHKLTCKGFTGLTLADAHCCPFKGGMCGAPCQTLDFEPQEHVRKASNHCLDNALGSVISPAESIPSTRTPTATKPQHPKPKSLKQVSETHSTPRTPKTPSTGLELETAQRSKCLLWALSGLACIMDSPIPPLILSQGSPFIMAI